MKTLDEIKDFLYNYKEENITLMEVCGTHTSIIAKSGIRSLLSQHISLVSGPGCPVCVTVTSYIDKLCELALKDNTTVVTFGDMIKVKGSQHSLNDCMAMGGSVKLVYTPFDLLKLAKAEQNRIFVFAAVGFETTTPIYALLIKQAISEGVHNIRLLTSLKTMPPAIEWICTQNNNIDGFIAPGHVCTITGSDFLIPLAKQYQIPFVVAGFTPEQVLAAVYLLIKSRKTGQVHNLYRSAVNPEPNMEAKNLVDTFFEAKAASWRGLGSIDQSGLYLKETYGEWDAGSYDLFEDAGAKNGCQCSDVIMGKLDPKECPLFGKACNPQSPQGACMVSEEGSCHSNYMVAER